MWEEERKKSGKPGKCKIWTYTNVSKNCKDRDKDESACAALMQASANVQPKSQTMQDHTNS